MNNTDVINNCTDSLGYFLSDSCVITNFMVSSLLNTSSSPNAIKSVYCLNPGRTDSCPYGLCPNPDIAVSVSASC
jgi:hypothetical protein